MEKIIIKNFACIEDINMPIKKINILIGEQASGKSICAKVLFFFKEFVWEIVNASDSNFSKRQIDKDYIAKFREFFPISSWGKKKFVLRYEINDEFIEIKRNDISSQKLVLDYSEKYKKEIESCRRILKNHEKKLEKDYQKRTISSRNEVLTQEISEHIVEKIGKEHLFTQIFIPAGRSFFALIQDNIFALLSQNQSLDPILVEFGNFYNLFKRFYQFLITKNPKKEDRDIDQVAGIIRKVSQEVFSQILRAEFIIDNDEEYLQTNDGRRIKLAIASSGQQEILPLALMLPTLQFLQTSIGEIGKTIYIEEPEAHLFPDAQRIIIELIAIVYNFQYVEEYNQFSTRELQLFITTHSPYILTSMNNLVQGYWIKQNIEKRFEGNILKSKLKDLSKVMPFEKMIDIEDISAYKIEAGKIYSIIDFENKLIDAAVIDQVSEGLATQFDKLLELDPC